MMEMKNEMHRPSKCLMPRFPLESRTSIKGLHAGTLFEKESLGPGVGDWIVNRGKRGNLSKGVMHS